MPSPVALGPNGTNDMIAAPRTPGIARNAARSSRVMAAALVSLPMARAPRYDSSASASPLSKRTRSMRLAIRNTELQTIAQVSAISRTISSAAVRWRRSVDRVGRSCIMVVLLGSGRLQLGRRRDLAGLPGRQKSGQDAGADGQREGDQQRRRVQR